jgi:hypothetical protein
MNKLAPFLLAAALVAGPASAVAPEPKGDADKIICRAEAPIGSRLTRKRCLTVAQWAEMRREARELIEWLQAISDSADPR